MIACLASVVLAVVLVVCAVFMLNEHNEAPPSTARAWLVYALFLAMCLLGGSFIAAGIRAWWFG